MIRRSVMRRSLAVAVCAVLCASGVFPAPGTLRAADLASSLGNVESIGKLTTPPVSAVAVQGRYAYVTSGDVFNGENSFQIVDLANLAAPTVVGRYVPGSALRVAGVAVAGHYAYLGYNAPATPQASFPVAVGVQIIDVSNPAQPQPRGLAQLVDTDARVGAHVLQVVAVGNLVYASVTVGSGYAGIQPEGSLDIVDSSRPDAPKVLGGVGLKQACAFPSSLSIVGTFALIGCNGISNTAPFRSLSLIVVDVSNPKQPRQVSATPLLTNDEYTTKSTVDLAVVGQYAYIAVGSAALRVFDISNPAHPVAVTTIAGFQPSTVAATEKTVFATAQDGGLLVADRGTLSFTGQYAPISGSNLVSVSDEIVVLGGTQGLEVLRYRFGSSLRGRVVDILGHSIPGVAVQFSNGAVLTTDAYGDYVSTPQPLGAFTVTPFQSGSSFAPASYSGTIPYTETLPIFTQLPAPASSATLPGQPTQLHVYDPTGFAVTLDLSAAVLTEPAMIALIPALDGPGAGGVVRVGHAFDVTIAPPNLLLTAPLSITVRYTAATAAPISDTAQLQLLQRVGTGWRAAALSCPAPAPTVRDSAAQEVHIGICATGRFVLVGPTRQVLLPVVRQP